MRADAVLGQRRVGVAVTRGTDSIWMRLVGLATAAVMVLGSVVALAPAAQAVQATHDRLVSQNPANWTPDVLDGSVRSIVQVGDQMVVGGTFTQVRAKVGNNATFSRSYIFAFDADTGVINTGFSPVLDNDVEALVASPDGQSVWVGGRFSSVNGDNERRLTRLNLANGQRVAGFDAPAMNGVVKDLRLHPNGDLIVGGSYSRIGGVDRAALASVDAQTGDLTEFMVHDVQSTLDGAKQVLKMDLSADGSRLVTIGNFTTVDAQPRSQLAVYDTTGSQSSLANWETPFYAAGVCASVFDTYMRDVDIDPTGSYFVVSTTGAYRGANSPCDVLARWDLGATGTDIEPVWRDYTGGDTTYAIISTGAAVYAGGHMRWLNNPFAGDVAGPGAVPREGIVAMDPTNGLPFSWNPGRARGVGTYELIATEAGLWVGSDTDRIGGETHRKLAFLPLAGGATLPSNVTGSLPNDVYQLGRTKATDPSVLYRVNAGGATIASEDDGPDWVAGNDTTFVNTGNNSSSPAIPTVDSTVPSSADDRAPRALFQTERWDPSGAPEMLWSFPVPAGTNLEVRLYLANRCTCTDQVGERVFSVSIDDQPVLPEVDLVRDYGDDVGHMESFSVTSDGSVDVEFGHIVENPLVNGIEIIDLDVEAGGVVADPSVLARVNAGGPALLSADDGPNWSAGTASAFVNTGNNASWGAIPAVDESVPNTDTDRAPRALFDSERWDPAGDPEMLWSFPVPAGTNLQVRLYLANRCSCTDQVGERVFSVSIDDQPVLPEVDLVRDYGDDVGHMESFSVTSDGSVDVEFGHIVENPLVNGIEIIDLDATDGGGESSALDEARRSFVRADGTPEATETTAGTAAWRLARGGFLVDSTLYTGWADGNLYAQTVSAPGDFGSRTPVDLYGGSFGSDVASVTGMTYSGSRIYYTLYGSNELYWRYFTPESRVVGAARFTAGGDVGSLAAQNAGGLFVSGDRLFVADNRDGALYGVGFADGNVSGPREKVDDSIDWTSRALFVWNGDPGPRPNTDPDAVASVDCVDASCEFDGSGSSDPDGDDIVEYAWDFGDGASSAQESGSHTYAASGPYTVTLTVTDARGATGSTSVEVDVEVPPNTDPDAVASVDCVDASCEFDGSGSSDPDGDDIVEYAWDFGDGASSAQESGSHTYAASGPYTVTLTVTDARGATGSTSVEVDVEVPPNTDPDAVASVDCVDASCEFDGSGSSDPDGDDIVEYAWDFGDGASSAQESGSHTYAASGPYTVTLTVTDARGATGSTSVEVDVEVPPVSEAIGFRAAAAEATNNTSVTVDIPSTVEVGDTMLLFVTGNRSNVAMSDPVEDPAWQEIESVVDQSMQTRAWWKQADADDIGATVTVTARTKLAAQLVAYSGTDPSNPVVGADAAPEPVNRTDHTTPVVPSAPAGAWVVSYWADKTSGTTSWTLPDGVTERQSTYGVGGGRITAVVGDSDGPVAGGPVGGLTATADSSNAKATMFTVVLAPAP